MIEMLKVIYKKLRLFYHRLKLYYSVNWTKTVYFNFKKLPLRVAKKLPVFFLWESKIYFNIW